MAADLYDVGGKLKVEKAGTKDVAGSLVAEKTGLKDIEGLLLALKTGTKDLGGQLVVVSTGFLVDGWVLWDNDVNAVRYAMIGNRVVSGMKVKQSSPAAMTVDVGAGSYRVFGNLRSYAGGTVTIEAASAYPRKDLITATVIGTIIVTKGTPSSPNPATQTGPNTSPPAPSDIPIGHVVIAEVWVPISVTQIVDSYITDRRVVWSE